MFPLAVYARFLFGSAFLPCMGVTTAAGADFVGRVLGAVSGGMVFYLVAFHACHQVEKRVLFHAVRGDAHREHLYPLFRGLCF